MAAHASILFWRIPWTENAGGLQSLGLQRVGQDRVTNTHTHTHTRTHACMERYKDRSQMAPTLKEFTIWFGRLYWFLM